MLSKMMNHVGFSKALRDHCNPLDFEYSVGETTAKVAHCNKFFSWGFLPLLLSIGKSFCTNWEMYKWVNVSELENVFVWMEFSALHLSIVKWKKNYKCICPNCKINFFKLGFVLSDPPPSLCSALNLKGSTPSSTRPLQTELFTSPCNTFFNMKIMPPYQIILNTSAIIIPMWQFCCVNRKLCITQLDHVELQKLFKHVENCRLRTVPRWLLAVLHKTGRVQICQIFWHLQCAQWPQVLF